MAKGTVNKVILLGRQNTQVRTTQMYYGSNSKLNTMMAWVISLQMA